MNKRFTFFLLLCVAFLDYMGVGLVFPILPTMLFGSGATLLPEAASQLSRGVWLGVLIALSPLFQFLASPILGSLSDQRGRKKMILFGLSMGLIGYLLGILGVKVSNIFLLALYRALFGISAATMTVVQATVADISTKENKGKNFAIYNMALGMGFTLGPFLGGVLCDSSIISWFSFSTPFLFGASLTCLNLLLLKWVFAETRIVKNPEKIEPLRGFRQARLAFGHPTLRFVFLAFFFFLFGWDYFSEFIGVTLIKMHGFTASGVGRFHAYMGFCYALSNLILVGRLTQRFSPQRLLHFSLVAGGVYLIFFSWIQIPSLFWFYTPGLLAIISLFFPVAATYLSNSASENEQGEIMGIHHSVQALALIVSPLFSGSLVGTFPMMPIYLGAALMGCGGLIFTFGQRKESFDEGA